MIFPEARLLLLDSVPGVREAVLPACDPVGSRVRADVAASLVEALAQIQQAMTDGAPYTAVLLPLALADGRDPVSVCGDFLAADPGVAVVLLAAAFSPEWEAWMDAHPERERLTCLPVPCPAAALRLAAGALAQRRAGTTEQGAEVLVQRTNELRHSEERFAASFRAAPFAQALLNFSTGQVVDANPAFCALTEFQREDLLAHSLPALGALGLMEPLREPHPLHRHRALCRTKSGAPLHLLLSTQPTAIGGEPHLMMLVQDISERVAMEEKLRQAQKMEAMGQLASGVAHDFNNILTVIQGQLSLQLSTAEMDPPLRTALKETLEASERAAAITRQLLTVSRNELHEPAPFQLNELVDRLTSLLQRLIGEHIAVEWECEAGLPVVLGDAAGIEQVIMNLVIQARDAMPGGGSLRISTGLTKITPSRAAENPEARPGEFVRFSVVDSGSGMDPDAVERLRTAFRGGQTAGDTTAAMSTVHGIVNQHGGWIEIFSDPGQGSAFLVYLPVAGGDVQRQDERSSLVLARTTSPLTVLLVEDEPAVRAILRQLLVHCGCQVIEAPDAPAALVHWEENAERFHLVITDIVMPGGMTGHDLANRLREDRPDVPVIFSSGYSADLFQQGSELVPGRNFLPKPYDANTVFGMIRRVAAERGESLPA